MSGAYILGKRNKAIKVSIDEWAQWLESIRGTTKKFIAKKNIKGKRVSTVFLGLDHAWMEGQKRQIFETMIFENDSYSEIYMARYSTYKEALRGHKKAIKWVSSHSETNNFEWRESKIVHKKQKSMKIFLNK